MNVERSEKDWRRGGVGLDTEAHIGLERSQSPPASGTTGLSAPGMRICMVQRQVTRNVGLQLNKGGQSY